MDGILGPRERMAKEHGTDVEHEAGSMHAASIEKGDILSLEHTDPVLNAKMHLVNNAIDEIGFTRHQWKLFILNGFGYAVDSLILLIQSVINRQAQLEFRPSYNNGLVIAAYVGMLAGALFWGLGADIIGRKIAFNWSLLICSVFAIVAGASPRWEVLGLFVCLSAFGAGGNLVLDTAVFLEYLPSGRQWMLTLMAAWWGIGQLIAGFFAWAFLPNFSCDDPLLSPDAGPCTRANNQGWRYLWYASGALVFVMSIARITVIRLKETPKFLVGEGRDAECVETLQTIAAKYNRPCSLTLEQLTACGTLHRTQHTGLARFGIGDITMHLKGLFSTRKIGLSTSLIWLSWTLIGLAYPLYNVFLPAYLATRGAEFGDSSAYTTWRNYTLVNFSGIWGPVLAGFMCHTVLGRKYTMVIGALVTMAFFFAFTHVRTADQNIAFNCVINFCLNVYYGTLYAYTPEVLPSAHRGTGNGVAIGWNRVMGILSAVIADVADTSTPVPIYICAALYVVMAAIAAIFPFEPYGKRSS
ncbi:membrane transporter [Dothidotthia symphoricarpi CBS 119687]|uniref:Membrane transporter n=1 Tax=Dothidotthia symphoricarpi CBS 119687 TaxID=1392245 RepID=A0A6A6AJ55_9PLEO|nr:membrane transporter [Dothidotthia symphoricarpi CBS 119687]KAF2131830.1 membrane transporter [Dothidotthia symphoricarpi CBS 119687]